MEHKKVNIQTIDDDNIREAFRQQEETIRQLVEVVNTLLKEREEA
jgi:uncharacterized protein YutE (UPF0331/DUF86 family)